MAVSRPLKLTDAQTILYEIDMFRYTAGRLNEDRWQGVMEKWVCLEAFLLHFRNLIEFFGRPNPRPDDIHITKPEGFWPSGSTPPKSAELAKFHRADLWNKYEGNAADRISKYLHHCTHARVGAKDWEVGVMYGELEKFLIEFENLLPDRVRPWNIPAITMIASTVSASTASGPTVLGTVVPIGHSEKA